MPNTYNKYIQIFIKNENFITFGNIFYNTDYE